MTTLIKQTEAIPTSYPTLSPAVSDVVWQRIESYIAFRYSSRAVTWIVEGPGEWHPPLAPATISTIEVWSRADEWETATLDASPLGGYYLPCTGPYKFTGTVGSGSVPAAVAEAAQRLSAYMAARVTKAGATSEAITAGSIHIEHRRSASWMAEALQNSGAADLLRNYRHV